MAAIDRKFLSAAQINVTLKSVFTKLMDALEAGYTEVAATITTLTTGAIASADSSLDVTGLSAAQGGAIAVTGGTSTTSGNAGGAVTSTGGTGTTTSVGGKRSVQTLALAIAAQVEKDQAKPVPVVRLKKDHYTHKSYGKIYTPVFEIVDWMSMDGSDDAPEQAETAVAEEAPRRRRREV